MKRLMIGIALGAAVVIGGLLAYRHFVTNQVTDKGGMENPFLEEFPADAALQRLDWTQNAMNGDDCFRFALWQEDGQRYASCDFAQGEGRRLQRENAPLTAEDWAAVEQCLKSTAHMSAQENDDGVVVSDETISRLTVTWTAAESGDGRGDYEGVGEEELAALLRELLTQTPDEYAPRETE